MIKCILNENEFFSKATACFYSLSYEYTHFVHSSLEEISQLIEVLITNEIIVPNC